MESFAELKRLAKQERTGGPAVKLALLGDCATQLLAIALRGYGARSGMALDVLDMDYNQIDAQTLDPESELYQSKPDFVLIQMCAEQLYVKFCGTALPERADFAARTAEYIRNTWEVISAHSSAKVLQFDFVEMDDKVWGNYGCKRTESFLYQLRKLNLLLTDMACEHKNVFLVSISGVQNRMGRDFFFDEKFYCSGKTPVSLRALPFVAKEVVDVLWAVHGRLKKCIVLDLDNTLWGGVIGDDGLAGIQLGELGAGQAFTQFQLWLRELNRRGVLLAVCSKNEESTAKEPFLKHPDMVLRLDDISIFVANWEDKASNIRRIQQTLNLSMDSLVFLDDSPLERDMVRSLLPDITVPELPEDPAQYVSFLQAQNLFETASYSEEDQNRTAQYQAEFGRAAARARYGSFDEYLAGLEMTAEAKPFDPFHFPRIAQLTQRSNQFNLRTVRYTENEIANIAGDSRFLTRYFTLRDKFGDHGLVGVVILEKRESNLFVDTWLMSCRVLKRGLEEFIINHVMRTAREHGFQTVIGEYLRTEKNAMVANLYERMGFQRLGDGLFQREVSDFHERKTYIVEAVERDG